MSAVFVDGPGQVWGLPALAKDRLDNIVQNGFPIDVELGMGARPRHLADIDDHANSDRLKELGDLFDRPGGMANPPG